ncbi:hypothetical protein LUZ60_007714 [Juncus effusus]|nr:hypothetical protein LUZ60_007714 [Juncus effusus]
MEARAEPSTSMFETSHILGSLLASSSVLPQSWHHCSKANLGAEIYVTVLFGNTAYVAFSGTRASIPLALLGPEAFEMVELGGNQNELFRALIGCEAEEGEKVKVQAFALHLFLTLLNTPNFKKLLQEIKDKQVILTGHALGGSLASLTALYLLCNPTSLNSTSTSISTPPLLCVTFGAPLLGNESFCNAILRERWAGHFCHVTSQHDIIPRLFFCPLNSISPILKSHLQSHNKLSQEPKANLRNFVSMHVSTGITGPYRPFGNYVMCSNEGACCVDNPSGVVQMLYLTYSDGTQTGEFSYGDIVEKIMKSLLIRKSRGVCGEDQEDFDGGVSLALHASGIGTKGIGASEARKCLNISKQVGWSPNQNCANLAIKLGKITPCRAQIEWYKALCDDDMGYYDSFKYQHSPRKYAKANINRIKLSQFWDKVIDMLQNNLLPYDFPKRAKWVNAAQFYMLLVEPLDIADYYRNEKHKIKGHYLTHGRERRYEVFDKWWRGKKDILENGFVTRSKFAGLTQDSCFWARVEKAKELVESFKSEKDGERLSRNMKDLIEFECYAKDLIKRKEVSIDVLAPRSSYSLWAEEWNLVKFTRGFNT